MDQVLLFDKTLQDRIQNYKTILTDCKVSELQSKWSFYLELTVDCGGWQAVWKISRTTCEKLGIAYPTIVLVYIEDIDYGEHLAFAQILAVQDDDVHLPEKYSMPLTELWPTKEQDKTVGINLTSTANALDALRFFYLNLYMPWDDEVENDVWVYNHLEPRLRLYYDTKNGVLPAWAVERLKSLITEVKRLHSKYRILSEEIEENEELVVEDCIQNDKLNALVETHIRIKEIQHEIEFFENPVTRCVYIKRGQQAMESNEIKNWVVFDNGLVDEYLDFFHKLKQLVGSDNLESSKNLEDVLENMQPSDRIFLKKGTHNLKQTGVLERGGTLRGVYEGDVTTVCGMNENVMFCIKGNVILENLNINASVSQCAIVVCSGKLIIRDCKVIGNGQSPARQGIIVLSGASLEIINSTMSGFGIGIVGNSKAEVVVNNFTIEDCCVGLKLYKDGALRITKSTIMNCQQFGIEVEVAETSEIESRACDFEGLKGIETVTVEEVIGENNKDGNVKIRKKQSILPFTNLFEKRPMSNADHEKNMNMSFEITS